jgi:hypothetical protein
VALRVLSRDGDTGHTNLSLINVADETALGLPTGVSPLSLVGATALAQASVDVLHSNPARQTATLCLRIHLSETPKRLGFCNRYVGNGGGGSTDQGPSLSTAMAQALSDYSDAITLLDSYNVSILHPTRVTASLTLRRGLRQGFLVSARPARRARRGHIARVRAAVREVRGPLRRFTVQVHVPSDVPVGVRTLVLTGTPEDTGETDVSGLLGGLITDTIDFGTGPPPGGDIGPRSLDDLASRIDSIQRWDGVQSRFAGHAGTTRRVFRDPGIRISGQVRVPLRVTR